MPDGLYCFIVFSDYWKSERLFYAHVQTALTVSHWMSGLKNPVDLVEGYERNKVDGYTTNQIGFPRSGIFFRLHSQPTWLCQTHLGLPELGRPTPAS